MSRAIAREGEITDTRRRLRQLSGFTGEWQSEIEGFDLVPRDAGTAKWSIGRGQTFDNVPRIFWLEGTRKFDTSLRDSLFLLSLNESKYNVVHTTESDFGHIISKARIGQFVTDKSRYFLGNWQPLYYMMEPNEIPEPPRMPAEDTQLDIDNAKIRAKYLEETSLLTETEVSAASNLKENNKSASASLWKREGKLFAVRHSGIELYPAFQFGGGAPLPIIEKILTILPKHMSSWQIAMWFASVNGWLDGYEPQMRLSDPDAVIVAAQRLANPAIG